MNTTKDLIIETTIKLIQSAGSDPAQITIRDISKEAGIAVSQINYHFSSKDNLIAICVQHVIREVMGLFSGSLAEVEGKAELQGWCKHDLFQFYYDTNNVMGNLADMIGVPTEEDAKQAVYIGACNLCHKCDCGEL